MSVRKASKNHSLAVADCPCSKEFLRLFPCQIKSLEEEEGQGRWWNWEAHGEELCNTTSQI